MGPETVIERVKTAAAPPETPLRKEGLVPPNSLERAYTGMGLAAGICGTLLPPAVVVGGVILAREWAFKGSLSAYYHSGMRDVFVGILCITGFFLLCYRLFDWHPHNVFSIGAGIGAVGLAWFPTRLRKDALPDELTPLQERIGQDWTFYIHLGATTLFFACLVTICLGFAIQERNRPKDRAGRNASHSPTFWFRFHLIAVVVMACALLLILGASLLEERNWYDGFITDYAALIGESAAIFAFGVSWWAKGSEFRKLVTSIPPSIPASPPVG